jgi:hypothetical protein
MDNLKSKRRTRAVNFRLSEEEFRELKRASAIRGARSLSDFARTAVWQMVTAGTTAEPAFHAGRLEDGLAQVQQQLSEIMGRLSACERYSKTEEPEAAGVKKRTA